jgi:hypothetical protein
MKRLLGWFGLSVLVSVPAGAWAQAPEASGPELGQTGRVAISAERLFGFNYSTETESMNGVDLQTTTATGASLFGDPVGTLGTFFSFPRLAVDAFVIPGLSVGAAVSVFHLSLSSTPMGGTSLDQSITGLVLAPRIGYAIRISSAFAVWPRAGLSFIYASSDTTAMGMSQGTSSSSVFAATVEVPFGFTVAPRIVIVFGPTLDVGLTGSNKNNPAGGTSTTTDVKDTEVGVQAGLLVLL